MSTWRPLRCSECPRKLKRPERGRPRDTCSARCLRERRKRLKVEGRAAAKKARAAKKEPPEAVAYSKELHHWMRTGQRGPDFTLPQPATIVSTWLGHSCRACR